VVALDGALATLLGRLTRSGVDRSLVAAVVASAGPSGDVDVTIGDIPPDVAVELYRVDLELVLRNLVRNALAAAARGPAPRQVAVDVQVDLEATGEEVVRIRVRDTNPDPLPPLSAAPQPARGLGLVRTALERGDGSLETSLAEPPFCKCVAVRLFRAMGAASEAA
jgi:signal transduction histidine kinase